MSSAKESSISPERRERAVARRKRIAAIRERVRNIDYTQEVTEGSSGVIHVRITGSLRDGAQSYPRGASLSFFML